jgi:hypothetical protein
MIVFLKVSSTLSVVEVKGDFIFESNTWSKWCIFVSPTTYMS